MAPPSLPDDFRWIGDDAHARLMLGDRAVVTVTALDNGKARICFHPTIPIRLKYRFRDSFDRGKITAEAWVANWQRELRDAYGG